MSDDVSSENDLPPALDVEALKRSVTGLQLGHPIHYFAQLGSTNTLAATLAQDGDAEGALVITDYQTAGRGRIGRVWAGLERRQLTFSLILRPAFPPNWLVMASALAVAEAIEAVTGLSPDLKWPNDVLFGGKKVCGILIETSDGVAIVGIGVNVNGALDNLELAGCATTLEAATGHIISRETLAGEILQSLDGWYATLREQGAEGRRETLEAWRSQLVTLGQRVTIAQRDSRLEGVAEDVEPDGALVLRRDDGEREIVTWGDVE